MTAATLDAVAPFDVDPDERPRRQRPGRLTKLANDLADAMTAKGHEADVSGHAVLGGVLGGCTTCGAVYRAYPGELLPRVWACSLHQKRNEPRGNR